MQIENGKVHALDAACQAVQLACKIFYSFKRLFRSIGSVDAVAQGVIAARVGVHGLQLLHVLNPHVAVRFGEVFVIYFGNNFIIIFTSIANCFTIII